METGRIALGLRPATHAYDVDRDLVMSTGDGVSLLASRYVPEGITRAPVVLIRTPYGRDDPIWTRLLPRPLAARGHQVVVQSVRGTFGSGGRFEPGRHEAEDGAATVAWLREQAWCDGRVAMVGGSYVALTQWAAASRLDEPLSGMAVSVGASSMRDGWYPGGGLALDQTLQWEWLLSHQEKPLGALAIAWGGRRIGRAMRAGAVQDADVAVFGSRSAIFRERLENVDDESHWAGVVDFSDARERVTTPVSMVTGWHDLFLRDQLRDHRALPSSRITIGPWSHGDLRVLPHSVRDALELLDEVHHGRPAPARPAVRVYVQGLGQWRDLPSWPPPSRPRRFRLRPDGGLVPDDEAAPLTSSERAVPRTVVYDPADPTPAVGGPVLRGPAGPQPQTAVEARDDVLVHTGDPLPEPLEILGTVRASVVVEVPDRSGLLAVRLCDVDRRGVSRNVTEGVLRIPATGSDGRSTVDVELDPTAHLFRTGHRLRVQVAPGAHPRVVDPAGATYSLVVHHGDVDGPHVVLPTPLPDAAA